eukprot:m.1475851 g.1475851  ORF g.1475851 m.1475851 type:complete len:360 (+) comp25156_c0_seq6:5888-6967(+)
MYLVSLTKHGNGFSEFHKLVSSVVTSSREPQYGRCLSQVNSASSSPTSGGRLPNLKKTSPPRMWGKSSAHAIGRRMHCGPSASNASPDGTPPKDTPSPNATVATAAGSLSVDTSAAHCKCRFFLGYNASCIVYYYTNLGISDRGMKNSRPVSDKGRIYGDAGTCSMAGFYLGFCAFFFCLGDSILQQFCKSVYYIDFPLCINFSLTSLFRGLFSLNTLNFLIRQNTIARIENCLKLWMYVRIFLLVFPGRIGRRPLAFLVAVTAARCRWRSHLLGFNGSSLMCFQHAHRFERFCFTANVSSERQDQPKIEFNFLNFEVRATGKPLLAARVAPLHRVCTLKLHHRITCLHRLLNRRLTRA